jgi:hypothetical protein
MFRHGQGVRHSRPNGESIPSSCKQIQQCLGSVSVCVVGLLEICLGESPSASARGGLAWASSFSFMGVSGVLLGAILPSGGGNAASEGSLWGDADDVLDDMSMRNLVAGRLKVRIKLCGSDSQA